MSLKGTKRGAGVRGEEAGASKRRRTEPEDALWQLRPVSDLKMSSIYNRSASEAPAELFRKDLISAMMLADSEPLTPGEYWVITDTWKQDWERGVQVPVNPDSLPAPKVKVIENPLPPDFQEFKLPRDKYIHLMRDSHYQSDKHVLSSIPARAEASCSYDLDAVDAAWLKLLNAERARAGASPISEDQLEKVIEELEVRSWDKIQAIMKSEEGLNNEYDDVICDVCRSPDSEDGNEMVFCDSCNICVHQACYGITVIPDGQWLCRPCGDGVRPTCVLCPNLGGAMKCTPSGHKWAHVSCVLWIPEVSIGCAEKMEPITKISSIPSSRWSLVCVLCRERKGACIQCSVKTCKTAYHVTCAFKHGLEMRAIIEDENADDGVKLRSYCQKHSVNSKKEKCAGSGSEEEEVKRKRRKDMTSEEKSQARAARLHEIEREFDRHVSPKDISSHLLDVDEDGLNYIYHYWKLKRRSGHNRPLLPPKSDDIELLSHRQEQADLDKMRMFVQLRQDLERVRNLCYMVSRREKLCRSFFRMREQTFHKQVAVLTEDPAIIGQDLAAIIEANHGPSIYDRLYSHANAADHKNDFEELLARIAPPDSGDEKKKDRNGMVKGSKSSNPYKKHYVNGSRRSGSMYSGLSSEESAPEITRSGRYRNRAAIGSSTDDDKKSGPSPKKKVSPKTKGKRSPKKTERKKKKVPQSKAVIESSSEEESVKTRMRKDTSRSRTLQQMEKEMKLGQSNSDTDDLIPIKSTRTNSKFPIDIYSDSSDETTIKIEPKTEKSKEKGRDKSKASKSPTETDSQQSLPRTKGAMKEFVPGPDKKTQIKEEDKPAPKKRGRKPSNKKTTPVKVPESDDDAKNKENIKLKQKDPTDLIVPQRQAAKKASENMRSTTAIKKEDIVPEKTIEEKPKSKVTKHKEKEKEKDNKEKEKDNKEKDVKETVKEVVPAKVGRKKSSTKDVEKETIAYVPQRQAAKKAAAHIKSGLGSKQPITESDIEKKKDEKPETSKTSPKKEEAKTSKAADKESSSSSSSSSSSYSSSSSSEEESIKQEKPEIKPSIKAREIKPIRPPSLFSPPAAPRPTVDLPFLDKVSRPLSSTSASSDSDSSRSHCSGSSPTPRRPRRRRKRKSQSTDTSPTKALDKKLKTSERGPELGVQSVAERAEPGRAAAATRARTRSIASSGNLPHKPDAGQRKPSKDDGAAGPNKTPKEGRQPGKFSTPERKANEEMKKDDNDLEEKRTAKVRRPSLSVDLVQTKKLSLSPLKTSPRKSVDLKLKSPPSRRMSVKEPIKETPLVIDEPRELMPKPRRPSRYEPQSSERTSLSPKKRPTIDKSILNIDRKTPPRISPPPMSPPRISPPRISPPHMSPPRMSPPRMSPPRMSPSRMSPPRMSPPRMSPPRMSPPRMSPPRMSPPRMSPPRISPSRISPPRITPPRTPPRINDDYSDPEKHWVPKPPSPNFLPPPAPVEKAGAHGKYMMEHKADVEMTEKSSVKMMAKIQATLNENTMIKSPKTPMDARSMDQIDIDNPMVRSIRKRSMIEAEKKYITQDSSHVQGVEISKSAKIPSAVNPFPNRSGLFSPQSNDKEIFEFDMMAVDDGFNHDEMMKPFTSYPEFFFKEDSKEQGVQETLNLVDRLRSQLSSKKMPAENSGQDETLEDEKEQINEENSVSYISSEHEHIVDKPTPLHERRHSMKDTHVTTNHSPQGIPTNLSRDVMERKDEILVPMTSNEKWPEPPSHDNTHIDLTKDRNKYDHSSYNEVPSKETLIHSDVQSISETGDNVSLSKQSDDSQSHLSVVDHNEQEVPHDTQNYDNNNSVMHSDTVASPYIGHEKWRESKIATRRSSASSSDSEESVCSQKGDCKGHMNTHTMGVIPDMDSYPAMPAYPLERVEPPMPMNQYAAYSEASPYLGGLGSLPLFGPGAAQLPLPSPGPPMYAPPLPFAPSSLMPPMPKPAFPTLGAAFTSSSQNIALTTAMIAPPTPKPHQESDDIDVTGPPESEPAPTLNTDYTDVARGPSPVKLSNENSVATSIASNNSDPKSPAKPIRTTPKFHGKSPGKSPAGISPKQMDSKGTKRSSNRNNRGQRGRGRSKSRAQVYPSDYLGNSIQSKLVGTVYDFDDELANDGGVDLKTLRDKRKSIDVRDDRKSEHSYKERSQSPTTNSPPVSKRSSESKETNRNGTPERLEQRAGTPNERDFTHVAPVLPGPVDMRTYQGEIGPTIAPPTTAYHTHLLAFASGTAEQPLPDIDEEVEKQLQSALRASKEAARAISSPAPPPAPDPPKTPEPVLPKVSLSDSRNQLKVKIKGPFLDANYSARPAAPVVPAPIADVTATFTPSAASGSTNLRRMRKKELLRQYWTQDMNMPDDHVAAAPPPAAQPPQLPRAVITIPKAVASMTSIPTREDYKFSDPPVEKKKRKTTSGLSRELRHLEVSMNDDVEPTDESKLSSYSAAAYKKRGRVSTKPKTNSMPLAPKLKIKIGANVVQPVSEEPSREFRPPKKRHLPPAPKPSMEDIRRESMKYRKMVMADFEEKSEKPKKVKPSKSEKRKKKKDKKSEKLQVVNSESDSATKLIIKIKRPKEEEVASAGVGVAAASAPEPPVDPFEYDPSAPDPLAIDPPSYTEATSAMRKVRTAKVTPIRLKLARSSQGSGYVMKDESEAASTSATPSDTSTPASASESLSVPLNKHCEVR